MTFNILKGSLIGTVAALRLNLAIKGQLKIGDSVTLARGIALREKPTATDDPMHDLSDNDQVQVVQQWTQVSRVFDGWVSPKECYNRDKTKPFHCNFYFTENVEARSIRVPRNELNATPSKPGEFADQGVWPDLFEVRYHGVGWVTTDALEKAL